MKTKERPILFSAPMVRALLDGSKTQTRRVVKRSDEWPASAIKAVMLESRGTALAVDARRCSFGPELKCPHGQPGDRLWVRENWRTSKVADELKPSQLVGDRSNSPVWYEAQDVTPFHPSEFGKLRPSMFMPRWASRITLDITSVRVERLQVITRGDAMSEGCPFPNMAQGKNPRQWYEQLWDQINGPDSWAANPWVWVIEFKKADR